LKERIIGLAAGYLLPVCTFSIIAFLVSFAGIIDKGPYSPHYFEVMMGMGMFSFIGPIWLYFILRKNYRLMANAMSLSSILTAVFFFVAFLFSEL
jgi:hypothetical protein